MLSNSSFVINRLFTRSYTTRTVQRTEKLSKTITFFKFPSFFLLFIVIPSHKVTESPTKKPPTRPKKCLPRWKSEQMFRGLVTIWNYFASLGNSSVCLVDPFLEKTRITPVNGINLLDFRSSSSASAIMSKLTWHYPSNFNHLPPRGNEGGSFFQRPYTGYCRCSNFSLVFCNMKKCTKCLKIKVIIFG